MQAQSQGATNPYASNPLPGMPPGTNPLELLQLQQLQQFEQMQRAQQKKWSNDNIFIAFVYNN